MNAKELEQAKAVRVFVDEDIYGYDHLIEVKDEDVKECERCLKPANLWFPREDGVVGLCNDCLIESYGASSITECSTDVNEAK